MHGKHGTADNVSACVCVCVAGMCSVVDAEIVNFPSFRAGYFLPFFALSSQILYSERDL